MAKTTWNYTLKDYSPLFVYAGDSGQQPNLNPAWQANCPFNTPALASSVCDFSSTHTTNVSGASVSLAFYGESVQFFGNVTGGMVYQVIVDGSVSMGTPSGQVLASVSGLATGNHRVGINTLSTTEQSATLLFESAVVTVGTELTGATVTRSVIQQDDTLLTYTPASSWASYSFDTWDILHPSSNTTFYAVGFGNTSGSVTIPFSGNAVFVYGIAWSDRLSASRVALDDQAPTTLFLNSSLPNSSSEVLFFDGLLFSQFNPTGSTHKLTIDNDNGQGIFGIDYIEIVNVTGGSSSASQRHATPIVAIVVPVIVGGLVVAILILWILHKCKVWTPPCCRETCVETPQIKLADMQPTSTLVPFPPSSSVIDTSNATSALQNGKFASGREPPVIATVPVHASTGTTSVQPTVGEPMLAGVTTHQVVSTALLTEEQVGFVAGLSGTGLAPTDLTRVIQRMRVAPVERGQGLRNDEMNGGDTNTAPPAYDVTGE